MKLNRLFEIATILLNKGSITAKELAERFGVSTRTIYRDIDVLSSAGVPVYMNKGNGGGIYLLENYAVDRTLISEQESENLLLAIQTMQATQYPELDTVLEKMGSIFKKAAANDWVEVDFSPWGSLPNENNKFADIKRAMLGRRVIRFEYVNATGRKSIRLAEPEKLVFKDNAWYLRAFCRERQAHRTFRISRIKKLEITAELFEQKQAPAGEGKAAPRYDSETLIPLKIRFQASVVNRLYDYFDDSFVTPGGDGSFILEVALPPGEWIYSYILSFGQYVEVLEPESVKKSIAQRMKEALKFYES